MALTATQKASAGSLIGKLKTQTGEGTLQNAKLAKLDGVAFNAAATTASLGTNALSYGRASLTGMRLNPFYDNINAADIAAKAVADAVAVNALSLSDEPELIADVVLGLRSAHAAETQNPTDFAQAVKKATVTATANI